ncbi:MAG: AarF/ABC1/UbiB kinase family protein [Phycisphaerales bacterium]|nr:AarF/ABC1/UbiB kinase family protein [Phycisphaerales bacterium]
MPNILELNQTIRHVRRYAEIVHVLARYGFADVVQELGLDRLLERGMAAVGVGKLAPEFEHLPRATRLRQAMEELGPTFVKLGQLLSTRRDLVPQDWADEFTKLQDNVPPVPFEQIAEVLKAEFGERQAELFKEIEHEPIGSASMAQVHRAVLADGTSIVLKILRPGIREVTQTDMEVMRTLAEFAEARLSNLGYSPIEVVNEFARELEREVDLRHEGRSTERLRRQFVLDESVSFPKVYWEATTGSVLALEEIRGVLLSRLKEGDLTPEEQRLVVANGAKAVLRMCLDIGFFHADPHPGNLFAMPGGKVCFIDCGMTGQLDETTTYQLADLVLGVVQADSEKVLGVVADLADVDPIKLEDRGLRSDVRDFIAHFQNTPLDQLNMADLLEEFFQKLRAHHLRCPGDLVLLIKALATIEAVGERLDPSFDMVEFATPHLERLVARRYSMRAMRKRFQAGMLRYVELVEDLPDDVRSIVNQLKRNRLAVNLEHRGLSRLTQTIEHASRNISFALIVAAMMVGSSILVLASRSVGGVALQAIGIAGFAAAAVLVLLIMLSSRKIKDGD